MNYDSKHPWYDHAVFYQIYPLSFKDSDGNGRGDIEGIISKADYLAWLGITAVWLSPVNTSSMKDYGYDVSDYRGIDPQFGDMETFDRLVATLHSKGIHIILDFVANHTSSDHPWFVESRSSRDNPKRDWYIWRDPNEAGKPPNNWRNISLGSSAWTLDEKTGQYYFHQFLRHQPDLNWRNPKVVAEMKKVMEFWLMRGVDGFRVDALEHIIEDERFRDEPAAPPRQRKYNENDYAELEHIYTRGQEGMRDVVTMLSETAHAYGGFIVNEIYASSEKLAHFYKLAPYRNNAPFNFSLIEQVWDRDSIKKAVTEFQGALSPEDIAAYALGNHDVPRVGSRIGRKHIRIAAMLLLTLSGSPFIYYGEELGMTNATINAADSKDTFDLGNFSRDQVRTPMQWDESEHAGFTTGKPWLPIPPDFKETTVEAEKKDPTSVLSFYHSLIALRKSTRALLYGTYRTLETVSSALFAFVRESKGEQYVTILNFSDDMVDEGLQGAQYELLLSTKMDHEAGKKIKDTVTLRANEGLVLKLIK